MNNLSNLAEAMALCDKQLVELRRAVEIAAGAAERAALAEEALKEIQAHARHRGAGWAEAVATAALGRRVQA